MGIRSLFQPQPTLTPGQVSRGLRWMTVDGAATMGFGSITGSGILAAFALLLGANNLQIGILAALPFMTMPLQVVTVAVVERFRRRKMIAIPVWLAAEAVWIPIALIPVFMDIPSGEAVSLLLGFIALRGMLTAVQAAAWNSWLRDLVPQQVLGAVFATRLRYATMAAMAFGLGAAFFVDYWKDRSESPDQAIGYTIVILAGALILGFASPVARLFIPEPLMQQPTGPRRSLVSMLLEPFRDPEFRPLLRFQFMWHLALNLATPFFAVYLLQRLGLPLSAVIGFTVLSQAFYLLFLRVWGPMADRYGSKSVLSVSASLYLVVILGWTFTTLPERYFLTIPLLIVLHALAGSAAAGVTLTTGTIGMKLAPEGKATSYLAATSIVASLGAGIGPLIGGHFADYFSVRTLALDFLWTDPDGTTTLPALSLTGFDFLFGITFILGLITLGGLTVLRERGAVSREVVVEALMAPMQRVSRPMSTVPGLSYLTQFPYSYLRHVPGIDVAIGVTGYQAAEAARAATTAASRGQSTAAQLVEAVESSISELWHAGARVQHDAALVARRAVHAGAEVEPLIAELARHTMRGVLHGRHDVAGDLHRLTRGALEGIVQGLQSAPDFEPEEIFWASGYGAAQGAIEAGGDAAAAAGAAVEAAAELASEVGIEPGRAAAVTGRGAIRAAEQLSADRSAEVERAVSDAQARHGAGNGSSDSAGRRS